MKSISLFHPTRKLKTSVRLPGSKSESNRVLILQALAKNVFEIENLSAANDTQILSAMLAADNQSVNAEDAGTAMRFYTAYAAFQNKPKTIFGSARMHERPIAPLVQALNEIGFDVRFLEKEGFPPLEIMPVRNFSHLDNEVEVEAKISSQFISALLLIAPFLPSGLTINLFGNVTSQAYIDMTLTILTKVGVSAVQIGQRIVVEPVTEISTKTFSVGGDWTSASYWYSLAFLADEAELFLEGLHNDWTQGDRVIAGWMKRFGVLTSFESNGIFLRKVEADYPRMMKLNFAENPDLVQTFAVMFGAKNIYTTMSNIESLKVKETDRINALHLELAKCNVQFDYSMMYDFYQLKGEFQSPSLPIKTYNDHRMAMAFAPLALLNKLSIENPEVVSKSYPNFWKDLAQAGFEIED
jgi:3-phosphoshikimate 1-carboxyvinyltransferase